MAVLVANMNVVAMRHRTKQDTTLDVLRYMGLPEQEKARVQVRGPAVFFKGCLGLLAVWGYRF